MAIPRRTFIRGAVLAATGAAGCLTSGPPTDENDTAGSPTPVPEDPRVDTPPYQIEEQPPDEDAWNPLYLCEHMPDTSHLDFQPVPAPPLTDTLLSTHPDDGDAYAARVLTSPTAVRDVFETTPDDGTDESPREPIEEIDFESNILLVIESGYGSSSVTHHWKRVDHTNNGLHLHGCHRIPFIQTADITDRHSVVKLERPPDFEYARVSLTVTRERRVHFNSTEGRVTTTPTH